MSMVKEDLPLASHMHKGSCRLIPVLKSNLHATLSNHKQMSYPYQWVGLYSCNNKQTNFWITYFHYTKTYSLSLCPPQPSPILHGLACKFDFFAQCMWEILFTTEHIWARTHDPDTPVSHSIDIPTEELKILRSLEPHSFLPQYPLRLASTSTKQPTSQTHW